MGVAGGASDPGIILLAGVAGLVAGAGSMAAGEWVSVRSQRELYERGLRVERWELEQFPEDERRELELIYRVKAWTRLRRVRLPSGSSPIRRSRSTRSPERNSA